MNLPQATSHVTRYTCKKCRSSNWQHEQDFPPLFKTCTELLSDFWGELQLKYDRNLPFPKINSSPLKIGRAPKGNYSLNHHFVGGASCQAAFIEADEELRRSLETTADRCGSTCVFGLKNMFNVCVSQFLPVWPWNSLRLCWNNEGKSGGEVWLPLWCTWARFESTNTGIVWQSDSDGTRNPMQD